MAVLLLLLGCTHSINYQSVGNFSTSNIIILWNTIQNNMPTYITAKNTSLSKFATFLSNYYNTAFGASWNVFILENFNSSVQAIFSGFAYQNQWMWVNNFTYIGRSFTFVLWRDTNCITWNTIENSQLQSPTTSSLTTAAPANQAIQQAVTNALNALMNSNAFPANAYEEIWSHTDLLAKKMQELNPKKVYSIVAAQNGFSTTTDKLNSMAGRFCSTGGASSFLFTRINRISSSSGFEGIHKILVFETRSS